MSQGPGARRRYLGRTLRAFRDARGLSAAEVARRMHVSQPTVSRIESGRGTILPRHVYRMLEIYGIEGRQADSLMTMAEQAGETGWWESYTMPDWFEVYASLESDAAELWDYQSELVPGLLQTGEYARAVIRAARPDWPIDVVDRTVDLRLERQNRLSDTRVSAVINESVARRRVGGPAAWRAQLDRLVSLIESGTVDLRLLPFSAGAHAAMTGSFIVLRFPDSEDMDLIYVETERSGMYLERVEDIERYRDMFARVREQALPPADSATMLTRISGE